MCTGTRELVLTNPNIRNWDSVHVISWLSFICEYFRIWSQLNFIDYRILIGLERILEVHWILKLWFRA